ncbi:chemokine (C-X-C motif) ligand 20 [Amia ocellicauda]|uniref:chemokine (C-X-C motif) ligand 20 n=1 Tax=Amia ocellicauda TaxID=2972642 RepID=UPI003463CCFE
MHIITVFLLCTGLSWVALTQGRMAGDAERCLCPGQPLKFLKPRLIKTFDVFSPSPSCANVEIVATLKKSGKKICLDPFAKQVKQILASKRRPKKPKRKQGKGKKGRKP